MSLDYCRIIIVVGFHCLQLGVNHLVVPKLGPHALRMLVYQCPPLSVSGVSGLLVQSFRGREKKVTEAMLVGSWCSISRNVVSPRVTVSSKHPTHHHDA